MSSAASTASDDADSLGTAKRSLLHEGAAPPPAGHYTRNAYVLSFVFFLLFTSFSSIQNLQSSIVGGRCEGCTEVCWDGSPTCRDTHAPARIAAGDTTCKYVAPDGTAFCARFGGACESSCPNTDDPPGWAVDVVYGRAPHNTTGRPAFTPCDASGNVGAASLAVLYAMFTVCCLFGPYVVQALGAKWAVVAGALLYCLQSVANLVVALYPDSVPLQWGVLVPSSALVGFAASFLWTAQGAYVSINAYAYAAAVGIDPQAVLGSFYGVFWASFQAAQVSGNFCAGLLLAKAGWSLVELMLFYFSFAAAATLCALVFLENVRDDADAPAEGSGGGSPPRGPAAPSLTQAPSKASAITVGRRPAEVVCGMTSLWCDVRMQLLIPTVLYNGAEQGFIWGIFTSEWVRGSVGVDNIGYVMVAFGGADVLGSYFLGRLSDTTGRLPIVLLGAACQLAVVAVLYVHDAGECDHQWGALLAMAALWGAGDAVWNTQLSCIMGGAWPDRREDVFSNLQLWQSLSTAVVFGLGFNPDLVSRTAWLYIMAGSLCFGVFTYLVAHCCVGLGPASPEEEGLAPGERRSSYNGH